MSPGSQERVLSGSPSMAASFARAAAAMVPGAGRLPFVAGGGASRGLPGDVLVLEDQAIDRERLAAYSRVCGFPVRDVLPPTYPHMLAFPLHLALMTGQSFPFGPIGLVHIENRIRQARPVSADERLSLRVWARDLRSHPRGVQFDVMSEARVGRELVWESVSTNLRRGGSSPDPASRGLGSAGAGSGEAGPAGAGPGGAGPGGAGPGGAGSGGAGPGGAGPGEADENPLPGGAVWQLAGDLGRRYASVSGDANPIHLHWLSARLFGFSSAIAHGMWTKARCLAQLGPILPDAFTAEVAFRRPILLPASVRFATAQGDGDAIRFEVRDAGRDTPHLLGRAAPA